MFVPREYYLFDSGGDGETKVSTFTFYTEVKGCLKIFQILP